MADSGEESDRPRTGDIVERTARAVERGSAGLPVGVRGGRAPLARGPASGLTPPGRA